MLLAGDQEKELNRAIKTMGIQWVNQIKKGFLDRAVMGKLSHDDELDADDAICANCHEGMLLLSVHPL